MNNRFVKVIVSIWVSSTVIALMGGCMSRYTQNRVHDSAIFGDTLVLLVRGEAGWNFHPEPGLRPKREVIGIATISLAEGANSDMELLGKIEFKFRDTRYVYSDSVGLGPDGSFLISRRGGLVEKLTVGPERVFLKGDETPKKFFEVRRADRHGRVWLTSDRQTVVACGEGPVAINLTSFEPIPEESKQALAIRLCQVWMASPAMEIRYVVLLDDLSLVAIQYREMRSRRVVVMKPENPDSGIEVVLPYENMRIESLYQGNGQTQLLISRYRDRGEQTAYLIDLEGNIISETEMPGPVVADSTLVLLC